MLRVLPPAGACHDLVVGRLMPRVGQAIKHDLGLAAEA
jgi:hypothetical protein